MSEAASFVYENISENLRVKYSRTNIRLIIDLIDDFFDVVGINVYQDDVPQVDRSLEVDESEMHIFITNQAAEYGLLIEKNDLIEVIRTEFLYCESIGLVEKTEESFK